jgi:hypothetical protein
MSGRQNSMYPLTACSGEINIMYRAAACHRDDPHKKYTTSRRRLHLYRCIIIYMYDPCCREIWKFGYPQKSYFLRAKAARIMTFEGKQSFISSYNKGISCIALPRATAMTLTRSTQRVVAVCIYIVKKRHVVECLVSILIFRITAM